MFKKPIYLYIATVFCAGFYTNMPGTVGSFIALVANLLVDIPLWLIILVSILGIYVTDLGEKFLMSADKNNFPDIPARYFGIHDPSCLAIDEVAGMWISVYLLPRGFLVPGFFLFRLVDILKPFPVSTMEKFPGGWGIMLDDILGGVIVNIFLQAVNAYVYNAGWIHEIIIKWSAN